MIIVITYLNQITFIKNRLIKNIFIAQLPFKNNFCTRKKYLRSIYGLVWLKLCWGKDMDMKKWKILERPNKRQIPEQQEQCN